MRQKIYLFFTVEFEGAKLQLKMLLIDGVINNFRPKLVNKIYRILKYQPPLFQI